MRIKTKIRIKRILERANLGAVKDMNVISASIVDVVTNDYIVRVNHKTSRIIEQVKREQKEEKGEQGRDETSYEDHCPGPSNQ